MAAISSRRSGNSICGSGLARIVGLSRLQLPAQGLKTRHDVGGQGAGDVMVHGLFPDGLSNLIALYQRGARIPNAAPLAQMLTIARLSAMKSARTPSEQTDKLAQRLLLLAAFLGLLIALASSQTSDRNRLSEAGAIARVNDQHIDRTEYASAYQALLADKSKAPTAADKQLVLDRLIEEELLVQRGLEIGLLEGDAQVRKAVAMAVIEFVLAQNGSDALTKTICGAITARMSVALPRPVGCKWRKFSCPMAPMTASKKPPASPHSLT